MTLHIVGRRSYLGGVLARHLRDGFELRHVTANDFRANAVNAGDVIVNCAWDPRLYEEEVSPDLSHDGAFADIARSCGARYVMLSSRAIYSNRVEPPLREHEPPAPQTTYGRNKVQVEDGLKDMLGQDLLVVRLGNVFGDEPAGRRTFISTAIESLHTRGEVELRMSPETRKDFLPAQFLARAIASLLQARAEGVFNVSSGVALSVQAVAQALVRGYGAGHIRISDETLGEEFRLDTTKLRELTGLSISGQELLESLEDTAREHRR